MYRKFLLGIKVLIGIPNSRALSIVVDLFFPWLILRAKLGNQTWTHLRVFKTG